MCTLQQCKYNKGAVADNMLVSCYSHKQDPLSQEKGSGELHMWAVQVKFKLCHMIQVLLKLRFTAMERLSARLLKLVFFTYKGGLLQTTCITQRVLATPTLIGRGSMNIINI